MPLKGARRRSNFFGNLRRPEDFAPGLKQLPHPQHPRWQNRDSKIPALLISENRSSLGCNWVLADGVTVQAGGDVRSADRAWRVGAVWRICSSGICSLIDHELPRPGSDAGYNPSAHVLPLVLKRTSNKSTQQLLPRRDLKLKLTILITTSATSSMDWANPLALTEARSNIAG